MKEFTYKLNGLTLSLGAYAENVVRVRLYSEKRETLFERYKIFTPPEEEAGVCLENGIKCGNLSVTLTEGGVVFETPKVKRRISFVNDKLSEKRAFFDAKTSNFHPERKQIVGDETNTEQVASDFIRDPKYFTLETKGESFYGLGESNVDRLILNDRTYLMRVLYTKSEIVIPYVMSKAGYAISCNTTFWHAVDVCQNDPRELCWYLPDGDIDFFIYAGDTLKSLLERFTYVTGRCMVLPKWGYGLMFIDQYNADQFEVMRNAATFREKKIPCDSFSLEPGWMAKRYDFSVEKKWNTDRFYICDWMRRTEDEFTAHTPYQRMFTTALGRYGFKLLLWLCCKYDFTANQENRAGNETDFGFEPWFKHLKTFVCDGASGFKMDPCKVIDSANEDRVYANGRGEAEMHSLQTTLYGKEMYEGYSEYTHLRPMHHISGGYTSIQKYSACTTGDSGGRYKTLVWILNSGLSGVSNITCDMDIFSKETIHYCFFSAWCELDSWSGYSHPWWAGDENEKLFTYYDRLRYRILPYIYSAAINAHLSGTPIVRAMPLEFDEERLKDETHEYMFGDNLLVGSFSDKIYLPAGESWIDAWTDGIYDGGQELDVSVPEDRGGPLFIRNGAVIPTQAEKLFTDCRDDEYLTLKLYPAQDCDREYVLYEDDGKTQKYLDGEIARTNIRLSRRANRIQVDVSARLGSFEGMQPERKYRLKILTGKKPTAALVDSVPVGFEYDEYYTSLDMSMGRRAEIIL